MSPKNLQFYLAAIFAAIKIQNVIYGEFGRCLKEQQPGFSKPGHRYFIYKHQNIKKRPSLNATAPFGRKKFISFKKILYIECQVMEPCLSEGYAHEAGNRAHKYCGKPDISGLLIQER